MSRRIISASMRCFGPGSVVEGVCVCVCVCVCDRDGERERESERERERERESGGSLSR